MVIDTLQHTGWYTPMHKDFAAAFEYIRNTQLEAMLPGKYDIGGGLFAIIEAYDTRDAAGEQMEAHKKHIDIQYMISGAERVGHGLLAGQVPSTPYDEAHDFTLFGEQPDFYTLLQTGTFMIFFPADLHMPCLKTGAGAEKIKKLIIKVPLR